MAFGEFTTRPILMGRSNVPYRRSRHTQETILRLLCGSLFKPCIRSVEPWRVTLISAGATPGSSVLTTTISSVWQISTCGIQAPTAHRSQTSCVCNSKSADLITASPSAAFFGRRMDLLFFFKQFVNFPHELAYVFKLKVDGSKSEVGYFIYSPKF